ncbi:DNA primase [Ferrovum sp. PN-J185]|uniref:DNA primase n=1 Tax=Ferrovum sp. PN-J185 TaxID=1356306 RepID=UPI001E61FFD2|nr:DNA primase [Ferrovum sp. PN-J185]MCC6068404.1 DNA primase [Ferrovum sp. PN-J185]MDE1891510.1 DNA primase [Betaproteobacteria bacterium]MDE2055844.1 DNA primase [Betaproteobacteria bacterium]
MIPRDFIQTLLSRVDIVDTIERYIPLKKAGGNFVARCPFHQEKSPSFSVSPVKQFYYCFGCGATGTAISFVMEYTGAGFVEAVEELANQVGLDVPQTQTNDPQHNKAQDQLVPLFECCQQAMMYYREQLKYSSVAIDYLKNRGVSGEVAARFGLGFAPDEWRNLESFKGAYTDSSWVDSGLVIQADEGKRYDRFRGRIMFPILNAKGQVIGFGGRVIGQGEPKYLNSPETPIFEKGHELYGLTQAKEAIRERSQVIVVEGYMDVVALSQWGIGYAVATLGTATTATHLQKLMRMARRIVFSFDGDKAGRRAAKRAFEGVLPLLQDSKEFSFLFLPEAEDPDSFIRAKGKEAFEQQVDNALPFSEYFFEVIGEGSDLSTIEGRAKVLTQAKSYLEQIKAPAMSALLREAIAKRLGVTLDLVKGVVGEVKAPTMTKRPALVTRRDQPMSLASRMLVALIIDPSLIERLGYPEHYLRGRDEEALLAVVDLLRDQSGPVSPQSVLELLRSHTHFNVIEEALQREWVALEHTPQDELDLFYQDGLLRLEEAYVGARVKELMSLSQERVLNEAELVEFQQLLKLKKKR